MVTGGDCYWIQITNTTLGTCFWLWSTAPPGDYAWVTGTYRPRCW